MSAKIKITTDLETLILVRKATACYLDELETRKEKDNTEYHELEKIYNKLCDLTF